MSIREGPKNTDIEVLRAVAISFTLISHLMWGIVPKLGGFGPTIHGALQFWTGVDLFFAISGFIITTSLLRSEPGWNATGRTSPPRTWRNFARLAKPFWIRRVFRLLPSAWLWIALTLMLAALFNAYHSLGPLSDNISEAAAALLNVANLYFYHWFASGNLNIGALGVYWSLSLEEQFYLVFPFLLFFVNRRTLITGLLLAFLVQAFIVRPNGFEPQHATLLWFVRTDALILGVLLAFWRGTPAYRQFEPRILRHHLVSLPVVGVLVCLLAALPAFSSLAPYSTGLVALISNALVFLASYDRHYVLWPSPVKRALIWLGSRSYSIYLIHTLGRSTILELKRTAGIAEGSTAAALWTVLSLVLILLLSELNYRFVEIRFRRLGRRIAAGAPLRRGEVELGDSRPATAVE